MITLIAEKPSAGQELARITGCRSRRDGYMEGGFLNGEPCRVTWTFGHLCELSQDEQTKALHWKIGNLPVIPERFYLTVRKGANKKPDPAYEKQMRIIERLFAETDTIVNCGDAGREGELIQRYVYEYVCNKNPRCRKPVLRLWVSSLMDESIRKGLSELRPSKDYDNLYLAGKARSEADWLVGVNATEALTLTVQDKIGQSKRVFSLGRVQTPTLAIVCSRFLENKNFEKKPFWTVKLTTDKNGAVFQNISIRRFNSQAEAERIRQLATINNILIKEYKTENRAIKAPLLHDITSLQQEASRRYNMNPNETLDITQKLYEKKLVTYPRTGSQFIGKDVMKSIPARLKNLAASSNTKEIRTNAALLAGMQPSELNQRCVNDGRVTDHHALLPETTVPDELSGNELKIYNLIAERLLEALSPDAVSEVVSALFECAGEEFRASNSRIIKQGWKAIKPPKPVTDQEEKKEKAPEADELPNQPLPPLQEGRILPVRKAETIRGETKPKPLHTIESLLDAMKYAGKESENQDIKDAMKGIGIGTPATRDSIIEQLMDVRKYIKKEGRHVLPTDTGLEVYNLVKDMAIADIELTGRWEIGLQMIEEGDLNANQFDHDVKYLTKQITAQILEMPIDNALGEAAEAEDIHCPRCGSIMKVWDTNVRCTNGDCSLSMNRTVCGKKLSPAIIKQLLEAGKTGMIKGFTSKSGKMFNARLAREIKEINGRYYANANIFFDDIKQGGHQKDKREPAYRNNQYKPKKSLRHPENIPKPRPQFPAREPDNNNDGYTAAYKPKR